MVTRQIPNLVISSLSIKLNILSCDSRVQNMSHVYKYVDSMKRFKKGNNSDGGTLISKFRDKIVV